MSDEACLDSFDKSERVFLIGDMNGKVGDRKVDGVVGGWGVQSEVDGNGSALVDLSVGRRLMVTNTFFQHKGIHRYTWRVEWRRDSEVVEQNALIDYVCVDERVR
ncbi:hypothetical protein Pcinc_010362 [Petrolisthes cinctipes]|uniref:Craniofacial development protein 2 n=1 Tax=Petrolisthes cinctipes TaxID=88211 RepID=A0AAE1G4V7_PETCI|nr:hypothetical protein Pcinc_010362 [Petrolisthes cinctipes]